MADGPPARSRDQAAYGPSTRPALVIGLLGALVALTLIVFAPVRHFDFVSIDDAVYVSDNPLVRGGLTWSAIASAFTSTSANFWHPLTLLSLMADVQLFGVSPGALHFTNLLLHLASTLVLFLALLRMTGAPGPSALVAALFAVHPLHVESVAWIAERKDVLSTFFWMLTLWTYVAYVQTPTRARYVLVAVALALGLMAKPMLVTLPLTLLLLDVWPLGRVSLAAADHAHSGRWPVLSRAWLPLLREKVPLFVLAGAASLAAFLAQQQGGAVAALDSFPLAIRVPNALVACITYVLKTVWPHALVVFYPYPQTAPVWQALLALAALVVVSLLVVSLASRRPSLAVGWFWFLITLLPVSGLVQVGSHAMADRYTYVPLIGLFIMVAWGVADAVGASRIRRIILAIGAAGLVMACATAARAQVMTWQNSLALWEHALRVMPDNYYAHNALGLELQKQGRTSEAATHFLRSAELAPGVPNANNNLGLLLAGQGRTAEAIEQYTEALRRQPDYPLAHVNLGNALAATGRPAEAIAHYQEALRSKRLASAYTGLGNALMATNRLEEAITAFEEAIRLEPARASARYNLGNALQRTGRFEDAIRQYQEALRLEAGSADIRINLGVALEKIGRGEEAVAAFTEAVRLDPNSASARTNLGSALLGLGRTVEAAGELREAVRLRPDDAEAHMNLGTAFFAMNRIDEALREHTEAVRLAPRSANARYNLAFTLQRSGRLADAAAQYEETLRLEGATPDVHLALGTVLEQLGRRQDAAVHFQEALRLKPGLAEAQAGLERALAAPTRREP